MILLALASCAIGSMLVLARRRPAKAASPLRAKR